MNRRRSERVLLQVRVLVEIELEEGGKVRLDAFTLVVNAHGGLIEINFKPARGSKLLLINPVLGGQESCTVVGVRSSRDGAFAVALEFDNPAPQFWPIGFPPRDWGL